MHAHRDHPDQDPGNRARPVRGPGEEGAAGVAAIRRRASDTGEKKRRQHHRERARAACVPAAVWRTRRNSRVWLARAAAPTRPGAVYQDSGVVEWAGELPAMRGDAPGGSGGRAETAATGPGAGRPSQSDVEPRCAGRMAVCTASCWSDPCQASNQPPSGMDQPDRQVVVVPGGKTPSEVDQRRRPSRSDTARPSQLHSAIPVAHHRHLSRRR